MHSVGFLIYVLLQSEASHQLKFACVVCVVCVVCVCDVCVMCVCACVCGVSTTTLRAATLTHSRAFVRPHKSVVPDLLA